LITNVYIDGFNLYHRALQDTSFKWLDLWKLAETLFPEDDIGRVHYFTARVNAHYAARRGDPAQAERQAVYLRALATLPGVEIHYGRFQGSTPWRPLAKPVPGLCPAPHAVRIAQSVEKRSDVNLVTRLLMDGFKGEYEQAAVVSNDSDFVPALAAVRDELGLHIMLVNPDRERASAEDLAGAASDKKRLWKSHLRRSQLPDTLRDDVGVITKPDKWR
jgi:uncharacterized LabA/DUF88 family protein